MTIIEPTARAKDIVKAMEDPGNWKLPLGPYSTSDAGLAAEVEYAVGFYHGGSETWRSADGAYRIESRGYYHYIGA